MISTHSTDEHLSIRELVDARGKSLLLSFFRGTRVTEADLVQIYFGRPVDDVVWIVVKAVLKERLCHD